MSATTTTGPGKPGLSDPLVPHSRQQNAAFVDASGHATAPAMDVLPGSSFHTRTGIEVPIASLDPSWTTEASSSAWESPEAASTTATPAMAASARPPHDAGGEGTLLARDVGAGMGTEEKGGRVWMGARRESGEGHGRQ
jgi:hypothetical protein